MEKKLGKDALIYIAAEVIFCLSLVRTDSKFMGSKCNPLHCVSGHDFLLFSWVHGHRKKARQKANPLQLKYITEKVCRVSQNIHNANASVKNVMILVSC